MFDTFDLSRAGAAGDFLANVSELSLNAFKAVIDINLVGSSITVKAALPYLLGSAEKHKNDRKSGACFVGRDVLATGEL